MTEEIRKALISQRHALLRCVNTTNVARALTKVEEAIYWLSLPDREKQP